MLPELILNKNLSILENRSFQMDYLLKDLSYEGGDVNVMLHFNITILPVPIRFTNVSYVFTVSRKSTMFSKVCDEFLVTFLMVLTSNFTLNGLTLIIPFVGLLASTRARFVIAVDRHIYPDSKRSAYVLNHLLCYISDWKGLCGQLPEISGH